MSMYRCDGCSNLIDTDEDPDCFDAEGQGFCEPCRDKHLERGLALAREHHGDLGARGCTCRWVGEGNNPDAHIKRDEWCPTHGRDPDAEREKRMDP